MDYIISFKKISHQSTTFRVPFNCSQSLFVGTHPLACHFNDSFWTDVGNQHDAKCERIKKLEGEMESIELYVKSWKHFLSIVTFSQQSLYAKNISLKIAYGIRVDFDIRKKSQSSV